MTASQDAEKMSLALWELCRKPVIMCTAIVLVKIFKKKINRIYAFRAGFSKAAQHWAISAPVGVNGVIPLKSMMEQIVADSESF